ncbi:acyl-CoA dehydratase activase [Thermotoga caldifontis]|uniref:acyl-CoA dehydratase activase n=1 Tax=Thermotoga caldifontis TaxID=1508419 RepID=UPI000597E5D5|nr:acyl-CoA dehydratase activase [Thermotoga caldifontis]
MRLAICVGSSSVSTFTEQGPAWIPHNGDPIGTVERILQDSPEELELVFTGRKLRRIFKAPNIPESLAVQYAYRKLKEKYGPCDGIVSAGGENFVLYQLDSNGEVSAIHVGSKCASGTGEFFLQQLKRMGLDLSSIDSVNVDGFYRLSSRCTVFCKSDCTHALNKGIPKDLVLSGLGKVMADKILQLSSNANVKRVLLIGGTTRNKLMLRHLDGRIEFVVPEEATYFEALGAYLWLLENPSGKVKKYHVIPREIPSAFLRLPPLSNYLSMVEFKHMERGKAEPNDACVLGVDVGSTTTKAVLVRIKDKKILASSYLRTLGDPIGAAKKCYSEILSQLDVPVKIVAVGVTGSGRKIVGLHAQTKSIHNEIMAHAKAAAYFDPEVDTIFEIGGQDAKYTYLNEGVPYDYAMNEACSAGTGSFLEEAARESLNIDYRQIADYALKAKNPPNFSDQCAAFINSDIKTAIQEGISAEDICAGLVYSVCMNYLNRVKGNRPVGNKVFAQGGTCYNRAVPLAMAALTGKKIVVPPEPGLMGAYGIALMALEDMEKGVIEKGSYDLQELANREVKYLKPFVCTGGRTGCDRKCTISVIEVNGKRIPYGGACNRYEAFREHSFDASEYDFVARREKMVFELKQNGGGKKVGVSKSFAMNVFFPFFSTLFIKLGFEVVLPDEPDESGKDRMGSEFCFPVELSHGFVLNLLKKNVDYVFIPRIRGARPAGSEKNGVYCPFVQSEADWLRADISELEKVQLLSCSIDFNDPEELVFENIFRMFKPLGFDRERVRAAFEEAKKAQRTFEEGVKRLGEEFLKKVEEAGMGIVIFGRAYNAFQSHANLGVPRKIASYGYPVASFDVLPFEPLPGYERMYWTWGEMMLKAARYVKDHPKLYPVFITNFSCGPDSFILSYFKAVMGEKPALVLELDSHTADAGLETRIEAFLDIIKCRREKKKQPSPSKPLEVQIDKSGVFVLKDGEKIPWTDPRVRLVFPTMGAFGARCLAAAISRFGVRTHVCPAPGEIEFRLGRGNSLSKECLPLHLTLGSLIRYLQERPEGEITLYFMPTTSGPCRFGQYSIYMKLWLEQNAVKDVGLVSLNSENAYGGLGVSFTLRAWLAVLVSDLYSNVEKSLRALMKDQTLVESLIEKHQEMILESLRKDSLSGFFTTVKKVCQELESLKLHEAYMKSPKVMMTGEIYVRWDEFSRKKMEDLFAREGIVLHISPIHEWLYYTYYIFIERLVSKDSTRFQRMKKWLEMQVLRYFEWRIKRLFARTGLCDARMLDVSHVVETAKPYLSPNLTGEAILTIGSTLAEIGEFYDGVIAVGPFACMPSRIAESILKKAIEDKKRKLGKSLPFISIELDGNPFTPSIEARLDAFIAQIKQLRKGSEALAGDLSRR